MANPYSRNQFLYQLEAGVFQYYMHVSFGAAGAPTLDTANSKGITSIVRNSAGQYTITLANSQFRKLLGMTVDQFSSTSPQAAPFRTIEGNSVASSPATLVLQYYALDNTTPTDPASGEQAFVRIMVGNSSV